MLQKTESYLEQNFSGTIYKQLIDKPQNSLVLEIRKEFDRTVTFSILNIESLTLKSEFALPFESWMFELCHVWNNIWIFTKYVEEGSPETQSILAFDLEKQEFCWQIDELFFQNVEENSIIGYEKLENSIQYYQIDLKTGENNPISTSDFQENNQISDLKLPITYTEESSYYADIHSFLKEEYNILSVSNIEYLEIGQSLLISYYIYDSKSLHNYLLHLDKEGKIVQKIGLGFDLKGIGFQTFYTYKNYLLYIKNKSTLICEHL